MYILYNCSLEDYTYEFEIKFKGYSISYPKEQLACTECWLVTDIFNED